MAEKKIMNFAQALKIKPGSLRVEPEVAPPEQVKNTNAIPEAPVSEPVRATPTPTPPTPPTPYSTLTESGHSIAPARDFTRVANSIVRSAMASGVFSGKSKQVYDYLYAQTRGAITPRRSFRIPMNKLRVNAGIGSDKSLRSILERLTSAGLITVTQFAGTQGGNEFTVYLPEEVGETGTPTPPTPTPTTPTAFHHDYPYPKVGGVVVVESSRGSRGLSVLESTTSGEPKTSFKTKERLDDEAAPVTAGALAGFMQRMDSVSREVTSKGLTTEEAARWDELAELLVTELKIAAGRTTVSNVPAFLTEHLRRRLWKVDKKRAAEIAVDSEEQGNHLSLSDEERRHCPDCAGTNFWYPQGPDKGVARCRHAKLGEKAAEQG